MLERDQGRFFILGETVTPVLYCIVQVQLQNRHRTESLNDDDDYDS